MRFCLLCVGVCAALALVLPARGVEPAAAPCGDAAYWSQRSAEWPLDAVWLGEEPVPMGQVMDLLELPAENGRARLGTALVVAELNLAAGGSDAALPLVYAGHRWLGSDDGDASLDVEASELAIALEASTCP